MPLPVEASLVHGGQANAIKEPRYNQWAAQIIPKWQVYCGLLICFIFLLFIMIKSLPYLQIHFLELCLRLGLTRCNRCISPVPTFVFCQDFIRIAQSDVRSCRSPMESFTEFLGESRRKQASFHGAFRALVRGHQLKPHHQLRPSQNHHYTSYIPNNYIYIYISQLNPGEICREMLIKISLNPIKCPKNTTIKSPLKMHIRITHMFSESNGIT